jgi:hypothetical protein
MGVKAAIALGMAGYFDGRKIAVRHLRLAFLDDRPVPAFLPFEKIRLHPLNCSKVISATFWILLYSRFILRSTSEFVRHVLPL